MPNKPNDEKKTAKSNNNECKINEGETIDRTDFNLSLMWHFMLGGAHVGARNVAGGRN